MDTDWREIRYTLKWAALGVAIVALLVLALMMAMPPVAYGHDWKRPDLDQWYSSLRNPNSPSSVIKSIGCCSKDDCHETEAEMRGNDWWARLGSRHRVAGGEMDWDLQDWAKVPPEAVLERQSNPTGSAVICHSIDLVNCGEGCNRINAQAVTIFCFIPPTES